jgi:type IX secretion system substrate protein
MKLVAIIIILSLTGLQNPISAQTWIQQGADIDGEAAGDVSGLSVSLSADGSIVAIGAPENAGNGKDAGHVRVCKLISGSWVQQGTDIDGEAAGDVSGWSVSLNADGLIVAIGAPENAGNGKDAGQVRVYKFISGSWVQQGADIDGEATGDFSGRSVSLSADGLTVAIGAPFNDENGGGAGHVRVYKWISGAWVQQGTDIDGEATGDFSGRSVSLSADGLTVAIGAPFNDGHGDGAGHVRVYKLISGVWIQQGADIDGEAAGDISGEAVSLSADGSTVAIGAPFNDGNGQSAGHVRVYKWISGAWIQQGADIDGEAAGDDSGESVSLNADGSIVAIGATNNAGNSTSAGQVRVYRMISGAWVLQGVDINGEAPNDFSGIVSLNGDGLTVAIGAGNNDNGNGANAGHVRVYAFSDPTGIENNNFASDIKLYPNPTNGQIEIVFDKPYNIIDIKVLAITGQLVYFSRFDNTGRLVIDMPGAKGLYLVTVTNSEGETARLKVMKN